MEFLLASGTGWARIFPMTLVDTVHTAGFSSQHGTGLIWLYSRSDALVYPLNHEA